MVELLLRQICIWTAIGGAVIAAAYQYEARSTDVNSGRSQGTTYDDFLAALRMRESGDNYQAQNQYGARGAYQFHEAALRSIGWYNDDGTNGSPDDWRGSFTAASGVSNIQQFLASRTSQDNAMKEWAKELWEYASSAQFRSTDYLGETIKGTVVTATGIIGGGHLWGPQAIDQYLDSGGSYDPKDPFGTPISEYVRLFSGYDSPFDSPSGNTPTNPNPTLRSVSR